MVTAEDIKKKYGLVNDYPSFELVEATSAGEIPSRLEMALYTYEPVDSPPLRILSDKEIGEMGRELHELLWES